MMEKIIIAGPCSAESYEQLKDITLALKDNPHVGMIRAGVWKPRTRPGGFEGLGEPALAWMQRLSEEYGVRFCCEVARPEHVALCRQYHIPAVWIGARTTANPFMVDEICSQLTCSGLQVFVKNPVCPDVNLWIGAIERVQKAGASKVIAIHRGFSMYNNKEYRNAPLWEIPLQLRREMPNIPIICDPSHIAGKRTLVASVAFTAMQLDYDGLMIEVHPSPDSAWTDALQQLSPTDFSVFLSDICSNSPTSSTTSDEDLRLAPLRRQIDDIDHELLQLLARRMELSRQISSIKKNTGMTIYQSNRWADVIEDRVQTASSIGLNEDFTKDILEKIHAESVRIQLS